MIHWFTHRLWNFKMYLFARAISQFGRFLTGIEIHPGAKIGKNLFILIMVWVLLLVKQLKLEIM